MLTEFTAFIDLGATPAAELSQRSRTIMTYALCGFANIASVGITTAGFGVLCPRAAQRGAVDGLEGACWPASSPPA